jgi:glutamate N-acetyltransferase / amino-acid N-acetyltransferase
VVMSTGIIGHALPMEKIEAGILDAASKLKSSDQAFLDASDAILTTDAGRKVTSAILKTESGIQYGIAGMCKGAGMIGPNMATMLGLVLTDCPLTTAQVDAALRHAADRSFNCISVEGHTSTNDSLILMASSQKDGDAAVEVGAETFDKFQSILTEMCIELAKQIPADGEGATHLIEVTVTGASTNFSARKIAKTIAESALVKTAITGGDPNWGRIVSAAGYSGELLNPASMALTIQGIEVYAQGTPIRFDAKTVSDAIRQSKEVALVMKVGDGAGEATFWTSDLTVDYVRFNSEYTT